MGRHFALTAIFALAISTSSIDARAWFFFIPGKAIEAVGDALSGAEGSNCVSAKAKVGDRISLTDGRLTEVKSLSGTSSRCTNPEYPIRALLEPIAIATVQTQAGLELPAGWEPKELTDAQKSQGNVVHALNRTIDAGMFLSVAKKQGITDMKTFVASKENGQLSRLDSSGGSDIRELNISGIPAWRYEVSGNLKTGSKMAVTYMNTIFEGADEVVSVLAWTAAAGFESRRAELERLSSGVKGIQPAHIASPAPVNPVEIQQVSAPAPSTVVDSPNAVRLRELSKLLKEGLITQEEYDQRRAKILETL
jgi:hypothetical protein